MQTVKDIVLLQKRELEKKLKEKYVDRGITKRKINNDLIKVLIGPRRAGKSFLAIHLLNSFGNFGYVNFDDEKLVEVKDYDEISNAVKSVYNNPEYVLFDEIQNLDKWELFANRLQRQGLNLVITGSNSKLLSKELATHLTGRHLLINVFPFSFKEFVKLEESDELTQNEIKEKLFKYVKYGGYPEPLIKDIDYSEYLSTLFNSILYKDIIKRFRIRSINAIEDLATYLISNISNEFSYNTLSKITKCKSVHTVEKYLNYLEEAFMFFKLNRFSYKIKEQLSSNKKIYCIDNGFIFAKGFKTSPDIGKLYENIIAIELKKRELDGELSVYYWKNVQQEEVDFVVKQGNKVRHLIQVCYDISDLNTKQREIRSLIKAGNELSCKSMIILNIDYEGEEHHTWFGMNGKIKFVPLWKWLLQES